jgi:hypothetical protein
MIELVNYAFKRAELTRGGRSATCGPFTVEDLPAGMYRMREPLANARGDANIQMVGALTVR